MSSPTDALISPLLEASTFFKQKYSCFKSLLRLDQRWTIDMIMETMDFCIEFNRFVNYDVMSVECCAVILLTMLPIVARDDYNCTV